MVALMTAVAGTGAVHVSWGRVASLGGNVRAAGASPAPGGLALLSEDELARAERTPNVLARRQFVAGRVLLRRALGRATGVAPEAFRFRCEERGKPFLPGGPPFSLSHSGDRVVVAVGAGGPTAGRVGVDVEVVRPVRRMAAVVRRRFAPEEAEWWAQQPPARRDAAFFQIWTRKEAFAKAVGRGLALPGTAFAVATVDGLAGARPPASSDDAEAESPLRVLRAGPLARLDLPVEQPSQWSVGGLLPGPGAEAVGAVAADWPEAAVVEGADRG